MKRNEGTVGVGGRLKQGWQLPSIKTKLEALPLKKRLIDQRGRATKFMNMGTT